MSSIDTGTAYGMKPVTAAKRHLTEVGPGTPMGELMRRYWQPFFVAADLDSDKPRRVRLLGEDLIAFRDKQGRPGLVYEHCLHRGTSLYYGRIEDDGIRCCNHGWKFDCKGNCLEQPAEPAGGKARARYRQPWYPVEEHYGLVYAYMGPPEKKPVVPRWTSLENLGPDEYIEVRSLPAFGPRVANSDTQPLAVNWLSAIEQSVDGVHVPWLHYQHSGDQFTGIKLIEKEDTDPPPYGQVREIAASMVAERTRLGVLQGFPMPGPDGAMLLGCNETLVPNMAVVSGFIELAYVVPVDDQNHLSFLVWRSKKGEVHMGIDELHDGKTWWEMTEEEHREMPGDYEAQHSMPAPASSFEHFALGDVAITLWRRRLEEALADVAEGRDPPGVSFDLNAPAQDVEAFELRPMQPGELKDRAPLTQRA